MIFKFVGIIGIGRAAREIWDKGKSRRLFRRGELALNFQNCMLIWKFQHSLNIFKSLFSFVMIIISLLFLKSFIKVYIILSIHQVYLGKLNLLMLPLKSEYNEILSKLSNIIIYISIPLRTFINSLGIILCTSSSKMFEWLKNRIT